MLNTRRSFLKKAAFASAVPIILPSHHVWAQGKPSERINMGFIGMGKMSRKLLQNFIWRDVQVVAVCDVDTTRRENAQAYVNDFYKSKPEKGTADCKAYNDFREIIARDDIDAVCIATPDHWHTYPAVAAMKAGMDVYCEKPLTHNIHESITIMKVAKKTKRILQTGSMQRSSSEFRVACELVRNGIIGKISHVECSFGGPAEPCDLPEEPMEPGLDWNMWVGAAKMRPYNSTLCPRGMHKHFPWWRYYKEFGGGAVCDWGAHHIDIAQWGLDMDSSGPVEALPPEKPGSISGAVLKYANGVKITHTEGNNVLFFGDKGQVQVNRGRFGLILDGKKVGGYDDSNRQTSLARELALVERNYLKDAKIKLRKTESHIDDFLECIKTRKKTITSEIIGARTAICCHLMNQAYYNNAKIKWDPKKLAFTSGTGDPKWLTRKYRSPWSV
jgi:predicted dehydrogenase